MKKEYIIFRCDTDNSTIVSVRAPEKMGPDIFLGVAECPDMLTAQVVLSALRDREEAKGRGDNSDEKTGQA